MCIININVDYVRWVECVEQVGGMGQAGDMSTYCTFNIFIYLSVNTNVHTSSCHIWLPWKQPCIRCVEVSPGLHYTNSQFLIDDILTYCTCSIYQIYLFIFSVGIDMYTSSHPTPLVRVGWMEAAPGPHYINVKFLIGDMLTYLTFSIYQIYYVSLVSVLICTLLPTLLVHVRHAEVAPCLTCRSGPGSTLH